MFYKTLILCCVNHIHDHKVADTLQSVYHITKVIKLITGEFE